MNNLPANLVLNPATFHLGVRAKSGSRVVPENTKNSPCPIRTAKGRCAEILTE
jgi:hypothetical protein